MELLSVNVGHPRPNPWKRLAATGIDKRPVTGPVAVTAPGPKGTGAVGLAGDRVYDIRHHGGDHQAVYAYAREDLDHWERLLGRTLPNGAFGENLTTTGIDVNASLIGERWRIGSSGLVLEVACPRIPCATFAGWLELGAPSARGGSTHGGSTHGGSPHGGSTHGGSTHGGSPHGGSPGSGGWLRRFTQEALPGPYLRVITPGELQVGDPIEVVHRPDHAMTVALSFRAVTTEPELLPQLVDVAAYPPEDRADIRKRLARGSI